MRAWQKRYFVLEAPSKLKYFGNQSQERLKGQIDLERVEKFTYQDCRLTFHMEGRLDKKRKFSLKAPTLADTDRWVKAIQAAFQEIEELDASHAMSDDLDSIANAAMSETQSDLTDKYWKPKKEPRKLDRWQSLANTRRARTPNKGPSSRSMEDPPKHFRGDES